MIARAGTFVFDTTPSLPNTGELDSSPIWNRWRPAEYNSELSDDAAAVSTTKNTTAAAQCRPANSNTMMNGDENWFPPSSDMKLRHGTIAMIASSAPT